MPSLLAFNELGRHPRPRSAPRPWVSGVRCRPARSCRPRANLCGLCSTTQTPLWSSAPTLTLSPCSPGLVSVPEDCEQLGPCPY